MPRRSRGPRLPTVNWEAVLPEAAAIVESYDTSVTLRQLFYLLVSSGRLLNHGRHYKLLSHYTAIARREGTFPALLDPTRSIHRAPTFTNPADALAWLRDIYRRDRTEGQEVAVYLGVEKAGIVKQLQAWFGERGLPVLALGGYSSQSYAEEVREDVEHQGRPAVLLYAGDFDASGEDIDRDFLERTDCWETVRRVCLTAEQVQRYNLPPMPGKDGDSRSAAFEARHGRLVQVELDAVPPETLRALFEEALQPFWNTDAHADACAQEEQDARVLARLRVQGGRVRG